MNAEVLTQLAKLLELIGDEAMDLTITVGTATVRLSVTPAAAPLRVTDVGGALRLRQVHRRLMDSAPTEPETAERVCRRAGMKCNSHTRTALAELVRWELLLHTPDGYCLPRKAAD